MRVHPQDETAYNVCMNTNHVHQPHEHLRPDVQLTPARQIIFDALASAKKPLGAYDLIDQVAQGTGKRPAPISIYRALDYLVEVGMVHRLASRNAYLACWHGHGAREPVAFLICDSCGSVTEATSGDLGTSLEALARRDGFQTRQQVIELAGICAVCAD